MVAMEIAASPLEAGTALSVVMIVPNQRATVLRTLQCLRSQTVRNRMEIILFGPSMAVLDTRVQQLKVEGQELMTRDKVTLRLTLTAEYAPADAPTTVHAVADVKDALYLAVQLAAREFVAGVTLDELLEGRDTLTRYLEAQVQPRAETFGVRLHRVGVKDVILPGEMKTLLNKVIEAEKAAAANVILRREDAAATRNMAQTAKVIAENPVLMRLKELETMKDIAEKIDEIKLVMGAEGLSGLMPYANGKSEN